MSNNVLYVTRIEKGKNHIFNKVQAQVEGLKKNGFEVDIVHLDEELNLCFNQKKKTRFRTKLSVHFFFFKEVIKHLNFKEYNYCFIRNPFLLNQYSYLKFLRLLSQHSVKTVLEIPTYPYKAELQNLFQKVIYIFETFTHKYLKNYISLVLYSGNNHDKIYSVDAKKLINVGNVEDLPLSKSKYKGEGLNLVGVSSCKDYHGYDRIILGLKSYYESNTETEIRFHIVGEGPKLNDYRQLIDKYQLENHVIIHGKKYGEELDELMSEMHIGVSCLGMHRIGLETGSPLKTAEFATRGLPMVFAYDDPFFSTCDFSYRVDGDESVVDISGIKRWFMDNNFNSKEIREFTINHTSWEKQYKDIMERV